MQSKLLKVTGMTCGGCVSKVHNALAAVPGVHQAEVSLAAGEATVHYDEHLTSPEALQSAVEGAGFGFDTADSVATAKPKGCCA